MRFRMCNKQNEGTTLAARKWCHETEIGKKKKKERGESKLGCCIFSLHRLVTSPEKQLWALAKFSSSYKTVARTSMTWHYWGQRFSASLCQSHSRYNSEIESEVLLKNDQRCYKVIQVVLSDSSLQGWPTALLLRHSRAWFARRERSLWLHGLLHPPWALGKGKPRLAPRLERVGKDNDWAEVGRSGRTCTGVD